MMDWSSFIKQLNPQNLATSQNAAAAAISGVFAYWVEVFYGAGSFKKVGIAILLMLIFMDWVSGIAAAKKDKTYNSQYGINIGTLRTLFVLCLPALGNMLDSWMETQGVIFLAITGGLIYHYWQSATANAYRAGWEKWIPKKVIKFVESEIEAKNERANNKKQQKKNKNNTGSE